jgi:hypothetical protein
VRRGLALLLCLWCAQSGAADVSVAMAGDDLGVALASLELPAGIERELTSGLTNRFYARTSLLDGDTVLQQRAAEIAIRYDLWDQKFDVVTTIENSIVDSRRLDGVAEVRAFFAPLRLGHLYHVAGLPAARPLKIRIELLLNPIEREKLRMIRKWVAGNSTPDVGSDQGISMSNVIFNRIFEQYADGRDVAAVWRVDVSSTPFRLDALPREKHSP